MPTINPVVQVKSQAGSGVTGIVSVVITAPTAGDVLVAFVFGNGSTSNPISIPGWTLLIQAGVNGTASSGAWLYKVASGGEGTITASQTGGGTTMQIVVFECSGIDPSNPLDGTPASATSGTTGVNSQITGSITPATATALVFFGVALGTAGGAQSPWSGGSTLVTPPNTTNKMVLGYRLPNSAGANSDTANWATAAKATGLSVAFRRAPQNVSIGTPHTTNTTVAPTRRKSRTLSVPATADTAVAKTGQKFRTLTTPSSTGVPLALGVPGGTQLHAALGESTPIALARQKSRTLGLPTTSNTAVGFTARKDTLLSAVLVFHTTVHVVGETARTIQPKLQANTAVPLAAQKSWSNEYGLADPASNQAPTSLSLWAWKPIPTDAGDFRFSLKQSGLLRATSAWTAVTSTPTLYTLPIVGQFTGGGLSLYVEFRTTTELAAEISDVAMQLGTIIGIATETATAPHVTGGVATQRTLNPIVVTHDARPLFTTSGLHPITVEHTALSITRGRSIGIAAGTSEALAISVERGRSIGIATSAHDAVPIGKETGHQLDVVTGTHVALPIACARTPHLRAPLTATAMRPTTATRMRPTTAEVTT